MKIILLLLFLLYQLSINAQNDAGIKFNNDSIMPAEIHPEFPGGKDSLYCFIDKKLNKDLLNDMGTTGLLVVQFIIDTSGRVTDVEIIKSLTKTADDELIRIIKSMPKWEPGKVWGKPVEVTFNLPMRIPYINKFCPVSTR